LLNWYFLLNAGGLAGTITLLNIKDTKYISLCLLLSVLFALGILFTIILSKVEQQNIISSFELPKIKVHPRNKRMLDVFELLSIIPFVLGLIIGVVYLAVGK
jgi:hypothetical protein